MLKRAASSGMAAKAGSIGFRPTAATRIRISPGPGVRLRDVPQFQDLGASELLIDDCSTHGVDLHVGRGGLVGWLGFVSGWMFSRSSSRLGCVGSQPSTFAGVGAGGGLVGGEDRAEGAVGFLVAPSRLAVRAAGR